MIRFAALLLAGFAVSANAVTLESVLTHPTKIGTKIVKRSGPTSLVAARVYYGTCDGDRFGVWEGGKTLPMPVSTMTFDVPYRRTCTVAFWKMKDGTWSGPSPVSIAEAL